MSNKLSKSELIRQLAEASGYTLRDSRFFLNALFYVIKNNMIAGNEVEFQGIGSFGTALAPATENYNINEGRMTTVAPHYVPRFRWSKHFRRSLLDLTVE